LRSVTYAPLLVSRAGSRGTAMTNEFAQMPNGNSAEIVDGKVPEVNTSFWLIKILATTLGETAGDAVTMSMNLGYLIGSSIFLSIFFVAVACQIKAKRFHPFVFWFVIVATTTAGTTLADFFDRSLGIGYFGGSAILLILLMASLAIWYKSEGSVSIRRIVSRKAELFYWLTIMFSQTLGTALGDWVADPETGLGFGYEGGALLFASALAIVAALYFWTKTSHTLLFWAAFILTRPLGATLGDFLDKPHASGGMELSRYTASLVIAVVMIACVLILPQKAERTEA
jgi:uncharacterized membrane-anchored protein